MGTAAELLVIIVSSVLALFLIVGIILGIYLIKLSAEIRKIAKTAQNTVSHIDGAVMGISRLASPMVAANMVSKYIKKFMKMKEKK